MIIQSFQRMKSRNDDSELSGSPMTEDSCQTVPSHMFHFPTLAPCSPLQSLNSPVCSLSPFLFIAISLSLTPLPLSTCSSIILSFVMAIATRLFRRLFTCEVRTDLRMRSGLFLYYYCMTSRGGSQAS